MVFGVGLINGDIYIYPRLTPRCHGNEIWDKMGYNSVCVRDICEIFAFIRGGGFGDVPSNAANRIFLNRRPLPWQRNLGQNWL